MNAFVLLMRNDGLSMLSSRVPLVRKGVLPELGKIWRKYINAKIFESIVAGTRHRRRFSKYRDQPGQSLPKTEWFLLNVFWAFIKTVL